MITEQYVSFGTALLLKEAGFDVPCHYSYDNVGGFRWFKIGELILSGWIPCPTQALAARWLREVHGLFIKIFYRITGFNYEIIYTRTDDVAFTPHEPKINFISYEECLEDALQEAVKLIKKQ